jgi:hypothetical protein
VDNLVNQIKSVPGQVQGAASTMLTQLSTSTQDTMTL